MISLIMDRTDLKALAKGMAPNYQVMKHPKVAKRGSYSGSHDRWSWNASAFSKCSEEEILEVYRICKESWK